MAKRCMVAGLGMVALCGQGAQAVDLSWAPQLRLGTRATDNVRWSSQESEAAWGFDTGGGLALKAASASWTSAINPSFNFRRFVIGEDLDADEYGVRTQNRYQLNERLQASLQADYVRDSTLSSELTDAGRRNDVANRDTVTVGPSVSYLITDTTAVNANYLYSDVSFDASSEQRLVDYKFQQWALGATHYLSGQLQLFANTFVTDFEVPTSSSETWTYGVMVGATYAWSDGLSTTGSVGFQSADTGFLKTLLIPIPGTNPPLSFAVQRPSSTTSSGPIANFSLKKSFENTTSEFSYARRVSPSIRGAQSLEDDILVLADHRLSAVWQIGFRGGYNIRSAQAEEIGGATRDLNRDLASVSGSLTYQATKEISLRGEYRFARQLLAETDERVYVNALFLSMSFNGEPQFFRGF